MLLLVVDSRRYERVDKYPRVQEEKHWTEPETGMERYIWCSGRREDFSNSSGLYFHYPHLQLASIRPLALGIFLSGRDDHV